jgi:hypothetical protein
MKTLLRSNAMDQTEQAVQCRHCATVVGALRGSEAEQTEQAVETEWGIAWPDAPPEEMYEQRADEGDARGLAAMYSDAVVVSRTVTRTGWIVA